MIANLIFWCQQTKKKQIRNGGFVVRQMIYSLKLNEFQISPTYCLINSACKQSDLMTWAKVWQKQNLTRVNEKLK